MGGSISINKRLLGAAILVLLVTGTLQVAAQTPVVKTFITPADSHVSSSAPSVNYGSVTPLLVKALSPIKRAYARFVVSGLTGPVTKATLKLYSRSTSVVPIEVRPAPGTWLEKGITYANAPTIGTVAAKSGALTAGKWVSIDVTRLVPDNGTFGMAFTTTSATELVLSSREASGQAPQLVVESGPAPPPPPPPAPAFYLDSVSGNDANDGISPTTPWKTLDKINATPLFPGNQVLLKRGGLWNGTLSIQNSGTDVAPIVVGAYGAGAQPIINGGSTTVAEGWSCVLVNRSFVHIRDLQIQGCPWAGVAIKGASNRLERNTITGNAAGVVIAPGSSSNAIIGNQIRDNNRMSVLTQTPDNDDSGAFGILVEGDSNEIARNTISGSDAMSYDYGRDGAAVEVYQGKGNNIHHNSILQNDVFTELGGSRAADNIFAYNVVRSDLASSIFAVTRGAEDVFGPVTGTKLYSNTAHLTGAQSQGFVCYAGCKPELLSMRNNVIHAAWKVGFADALFEETNNLFSGGQRVFTVGPLSLVADPKFQDPVGGNLRLTSGSPAIDRGVSLAGYSLDLDSNPVPKDGNGDGVALPDIGAYEFISGITSATAVAEPLPPAPEPRPAPQPGQGPPPTPRPAPPPPGLLDSVVDGVVGTVKGIADPLLPG